MKKVLRSQDGFTFLEMSIVVAIIGILLLMAMPNYQGAAEKAQAKSCEANRKMIEAQVVSYMVDTSIIPTELAPLVATGYLREIPKCPLKGNYSFAVVEASGTAMGKVNVYCPTHAPASN
ncbi:competence type IV pilus major pilin ComGC [Ammoniphilus sp. YIM 78166]|uniref:competence type IV pilus major pilin ComGC n=1 Tax=Ammoniphilus sp. YIM 78166 TaxID=1644106 RepID=UPI00106F191A|nr:prepilin-type N-terminal cleavage/methylation domain-containing protein [Ammoniphilus sp. YIM 78166]